MANYVIISEIRYTGRIEIEAGSLNDARQIAGRISPVEWDNVYPYDIEIKSIEELDD